MWLVALANAQARCYGPGRCSRSDMPSTEPRPFAAAWMRWPLALLRYLLKALWVLVQALIVVWVCLAIYYSNLPWPLARAGLAVSFLLFGAWALGWSRSRRAISIFAMLSLAVVVWFSSIAPSHDREWRREVAVMPRAIIDGDRVRLVDVRNFEYRSRHDFTEHFEEREVLISHLVALDFFVSFWTPGPVGHTFVSFIFDNAPPVSISIETRPEVGESFDPLASLFKQFELIYVVGDERDVVGSRTTHRNEEVYLYRVQSSPEAVRRLFRIYLDRINELHDRPEFYHLLSNSCTINIVRYANAAGRVGRFELRHLLNGLIDGYLYASGRLDPNYPFEELRRRGHINAAARAAGEDPDFSSLIRADVPGMSLPPIVSGNPRSAEQ